MSNLENYIEGVRKYCKENYLNEFEKIRYVYIDLGRKYYFNLDFAFGNTKTRKQIYRRSKNMNSIDKSVYTGEIICTTLSEIYKKIMNDLGVDVKVESEDMSFSRCPHVYNVVTDRSGIRYIVDLQRDLENIQSRAVTKAFGLSLDDKKEIFSRFELERIDRKIGYIDNENYYSNDYLFLLKYDINFIDDFDMKAKHVIENIEINDNKKMKYAERKWHYENILEELFTKKELNKIHLLDCYKQVNDKKYYRSYIAVENSNNTAIFEFNKEDSRYLEIPIEEFAKKIQNGMVCMQGVPRLRKTMRKIKEDEER